MAATQACEFVGLPECQLTLSQTVIYLACAEKSNSATTAIGAALRDVKESKIIPVPVHLKDSHYAGAKQLGHGQGYQYAHDAPDGVAAQDYLGVEKTFYQPTPRGWEGQNRERLETIRKRLRSSQRPADESGS
jgi:putative ATPase